VQVAEDQTARRVGVAEGALILTVAPNSAAAEAGLRGTRRDDNGRVRLGDVILAVNDQPIRKANDLYVALDKFQPGDAIVLTVLRDEKREEIKVSLRAAD